ncbi:hypothetical protein SDJN03_14385, partial [Cucurbita argyrosperma subsp. sororia]
MALSGNSPVTIERRRERCFIFDFGSVPEGSSVHPARNRPASVSVRGSINPSLENSVGVIILQHSLEKKHPLNSSRIAKLEFSFGNGQNAAQKPQIQVQNRDESLVGKPTCTKSDEGAAITATIGKYGVVNSFKHIWMHQPSLQDLKIDEIFASPEIRSSMAKGFIVKKLQKRQVDESKELEEYAEFEIEVPPKSVLLFPSDNAFTVNDDDVHGSDFHVNNLIVLDGTWAKAKRMYNENPWLRLLPHMKLDLEKMSLYSEVRRQPKTGFLSTIESIVYALKVIGDHPEGLDDLLDVFESMIGDQRRCKDERLRITTQI